MYTFTHIRTFVKVVELNNFSAAAREMKLTVAAVSKHVSQLEQALNIQLMTRTTRKLSLTDVGHQYYLQCKNILRAINDADAVIAQTQNEPTGILRVKSERYFAERFIVPKIAAYQAKHPQVKLDLDIAERTPDLGRENFDVVFGRSVLQAENIMQKTITTTHFTLCASPAYLEKHGTPKKPRDLINHHYLSHSMRIPNDLLQFDKGEKIYLDPILLLNDSDALLHCALNDMGIIKLQHYVVNEALRSGQLIELLTNHAHQPIPIHVFYQPESFLHTKVRTFIDFICHDLPGEM